jgi:diguanylate cyclase (GGDEF)-like protein/PAS domain S-box-containing protein
MADSTEHDRLQRLLGLAWDAFPMAAVIVDQEGTIRHCSDQTNYLLGYEPGRLVGVHVEHLMAKQEDRGSDGQDADRSVEERTLGGDLELYVRKQDGTTLPVRLSLTQISDLETTDEIWTLVLMQDQRPLKAQDRDSTVEKRYWQLFNQNQVGLIWARLDGEVLSCNPAAAQMFGYTSTEAFEGQSFADHYRGDLSEREDTLKRLRAEGEVSNWNVPMKRRDGSPFMILESLVLYEDSEYDGPVIVSSFVEVTQQARLWEELKEMAYHDPLTGLPNRRFLKEQAPKVFSLADRRERYAGVAYMDLDGFKAVNDQWGHETGDEVLVSIAERLERTIRESDVLARIGGDEFAILWADLDAPEEARAATERVVRSFEEPFTVGDKRFSLDLSVGLAAFPTDGEHIDELLHRADQAMYRAKEQGEEMMIVGAEELR